MGIGTFIKGWKRLHWTAKTGIWLATLYGVYIVVGFFVLPPVATRLIQDRLAEQLGRRVVIEDIRFNPLVFRTRISGVAVYGTDNATLDLSLGSLSVDAQVSSIFRRGLVLTRVSLDSPYAFVRILDNNGRSNLQDLFTRKGPQVVDAPVPETDTQEDKPFFPIIIEGLFCHNGTVRIQDDPKAHTQVIDQIALTVPFFSSRLADRDIQVQPLLRFRLNETPFELKGKSIPFAASRRTEFDLSGAGLDLTRFWNYVPIGPSLSLSAGLFTSNASLVFEQTPLEKRPFSLFIKGDFRVNNVELTHARDGKILTCKHARAVLERFRLLPREAVFSKIILDDPFISVERSKEGELNWISYAHEVQTGTPAAAPAPPAEPPVSLRLMADSIRLNNGRVSVRDRLPASGFTTTLAPVDLGIDHLDTQENATTAAFITVHASQGEIIGVNATVVVSPFACQGTFSLTNASIPTYAPYFGPLFPLDVARGAVACSSRFAFAAGETPRMQLTDITGSVAGVELRMPGSSKEKLGFQIFTFDNGTVDLNEHRMGFSRLVLTKPTVQLERNPKGIVDLLALFVPPDKEGAHVVPPATNATSVPWSVGIDAVDCVDGDLMFTDQAVKLPAVNRLHALNLTLRGVDSDPNHALDFQFATRVNKGGDITASGNLVPLTLKTRGTVRIASLGLSAITPYLPSSVHLDVTQGDLDVDGTWDLHKKGDMAGSVTGKVGVTGVLLKDLESKKDLFGFTACTLDGIEVHLMPNTLRMRSAVLQVPRTFLEKDEQGVLNFVRVLGGDTNKQAEEAASPAEPGAVSDDQKADATQPSFFTKVDVDSVRIEHGRVAFHDRSLSPDFIANLDQINAQVTNVSLDPVHKAVLDLNATLNNHAPLSLSGILSPLRRPIASDLAFRLAHLDMTSLTPYTLKSLAYPVRKGKLNWNGKFMTENYVLDAKNTFFVEQFELGEKVDVPGAASVPIKLGLALLQDTNGDLTLDVPVHGELNDPQFRLGGVIFKAILGIFSKIATAPFALIGSMFGGGEDLSQLVYTAGSAASSSGTQTKLDVVIKALQKRPGLRG